MAGQNHFFKRLFGLYGGTLEFFFDGLVAIHQGQNFSTGLPDQPVEITFEIIKRHTIRFGIDGKKYTDIPKDEFLRGMIAGFIDFLTYSPIIAPDNNRWIDYMRGELHNLSNFYNIYNYDSRFNQTKKIYSGFE